MNLSPVRAAPSPIVQLVDDVVSCLEAGKAIRRDVGKDGRLHIDRPLPFLCLHLTGGTKISLLATLLRRMRLISSHRRFRRQRS